ncbi:MAG: hypothetical protein D6732_01750 [Methanobacteriota archaeon]|nr:MAG: hypothetical protein D6732_01750 [Euryarchaeota archaeon]
MSSFMMCNTRQIALATAHALAQVDTVLVNHTEIRHFFSANEFYRRNLPFRAFRSFGEKPPLSPPLKNTPSNSRDNHKTDDSEDISNKKPNRNTNKKE